MISFLPSQAGSSGGLGTLSRDVSELSMDMVASWVKPGPRHLWGKVAEGRGEAAGEFAPLLVDRKAGCFDWSHVGTEVGHTTRDGLEVFNKTSLAQELGYLCSIVTCFSNLA
jgi:hypothetical protein